MFFIVLNLIYNNDCYNRVWLYKNGSFIAEIMILFSYSEQPCLFDDPITEGVLISLFSRFNVVEFDVTTIFFPFLRCKKNDQSFSDIFSQMSVNSSLSKLIYFVPLSNFPSWCRSLFCLSFIFVEGNLSPFFYKLKY